MKGEDVAVWVVILVVMVVFMAGIWLAGDPEVVVSRGRGDYLGSAMDLKYLDAAGAIDSVSTVAKPNVSSATFYVGNGVRVFGLSYTPTGATSELMVYDRKLLSATGQVDGYGAGSDRYALLAESDAHPPVLTLRGWSGAKETRWIEFGKPLWVANAMLMWATECEVLLHYADDLRERD